MAKLSLMFENKLVKEVPIGSRPVTIGRSPDNDLPVDNLAVSNYHARVYFEAGRLVVEDLDSLNGTFVNDLRVERATLHDGDSIWVGKHHIKVDASPYYTVPVVFDGVDFDGETAEDPQFRQFGGVARFAGPVRTVNRDLRLHRIPCRLSARVTSTTATETQSSTSAIE